jgi:hypothetical protein
VETIQPKVSLSRSDEWVLRASILLGAILLAVSIFRWTLVKVLTPFIEPTLESILRVAFVIVLLWALVHFIWQAKKLGAKRAGTPLLVNVSVLLIVLFVPFSEITVGLDFRWNYRKRAEVVSDVLDGKMNQFITNSGGLGDFIHLPSSYRGLSDGDDIMVYRRDGQTLIFFFDFRGILDSFSGFVYSTDDTTPKNGDFGGQFVEIDHLRPNWYWASSAN